MREYRNIENLDNLVSLITIAPILTAYRIDIVAKTLKRI